MQQPSNLDELIKQLQADWPQAHEAWELLRPSETRNPYAGMHPVPLEELRLNEK